MILSSISVRYLQLTIISITLLLSSVDGFATTRIATTLVKPNVEVTTLLCHINKVRSIQEPPVPPLGFQRELLAISADKANELGEADGNWTEIDTNLFADRFCYFNYRWLAASEVSFVSVANANDALKALLNDEGSFRILTQGKFNHFGGSFDAKKKVWSLTLARGYGDSTLPSCSTLSENFRKGISAKLSKFRRLNSKGLDYHIVTTSTPHNRTGLPPGAPNSYEEDFIMVATNTTRASRKTRIKQSLSNSHAASWLRRYRSDSLPDGDFDYKASEVSQYPFDLVELLCYINYVRSQARPARQPLGAHLALMEVARNHTEVMALSGLLANVLPGGDSVGERLLGAGYEWKAYGQNIARGWSNVKRLLIAQLEAQDDREKLLGPGFTSFGAWHVPRGDYWTFLLARGDKAAPPPSCPPRWDPTFLLEHV